MAIHIKRAQYSPFSGGLFYLTALFPKEYPEKPSEIWFITPIYHLEVNPRIPKGKGLERLGYISHPLLIWWKTGYSMEILF